MTILHKSRIIYGEVCFGFRTYRGKFGIFPKKDSLQTGFAEKKNRQTGAKDYFLIKNISVRTLTK